MTPDPIKQLAAALAELPSIGPRQALRLAFHLVSGGGQELKDLSLALLKAGSLATCPQCFFITNDADGICSICADKNRDQTMVAIVEKETDLITLERAKSFTGTYLVLGQLRSDGVLESRHKNRLQTLKKRFAVAPAKEIILALSPTTYGDVQASVISQELKGVAEKITRLGRGIPTGGEIEFSDEATLSDALKNRN